MNLKIDIDTDFRTRRAKGRLTLKDVCEGTGISAARLSDYENSPISYTKVAAYVKIDNFLKTKDV